VKGSPTHAPLLAIQFLNRKNTRTFNTVIASEAKQSIAQQERKSGLLRRLRSSQ
jgi:hypothetical protein